jgi:probable addiction module antidote protein
MENDSEGKDMRTTDTRRFDTAEYLDSEEMIAAYLNAALEEGDPDLLVAAIADVAKARGMGSIAVQAGLGRESLYKTLSPGSKPRLETVFKLLHALGVRFKAVPETEVRA